MLLIVICSLTLKKETIVLAVAPGEKRLVTIVTTNAPKKDAPCKVTNITPKKRTIDLKTKKVEEGYETTFSTWDIGTHIIKVEYDSKEIPDSPFEVMVEKIDVTKVTVIGLDTRKFQQFDFVMHFDYNFM